MKVIFYIVDCGLCTLKLELCENVSGKMYAIFYTMGLDQKAAVSELMDNYEFDKKQPDSNWFVKKCESKKGREVLKKILKEDIDESFDPTKEYKIFKNIEELLRKFKCNN